MKQNEPIIIPAYVSSACNSYYCHKTQSFRSNLEYYGSAIIRGNAVELIDNRVKNENI